MIINMKYVAVEIPLSYILIFIIIVDYKGWLVINPASVLVSGNQKYFRSTSTSVPFNLFKRCPF